MISKHKIIIADAIKQSGKTFNFLYIEITDADL